MGEERAKYETSSQGAIYLSFVSVNQEITPETLHRMIGLIPKDGRHYYWSVNYSQLAELVQVQTPFEYILKLVYGHDKQWRYFLFGIPVKVTNLDEPISIKPEEEVSRRNLPKTTY